jgi:hypothetical protein
VAKKWAISVITQSLPIVVNLAVVRVAPVYHMYTYVTTLGTYMTYAPFDIPLQFLRAT